MVKNAERNPQPSRSLVRNAGERKRGGREQSSEAAEDPLIAIQALRKKNDAAEKVLAEMSEQTGWSKSYLKQYFENRNNFENSEEWDAIQKQRQEFMRSFRVFQRKQERAIAAKKATATSANSPATPSPTKRRGPKNSERRRHWLFVR